MVSTNDYVLKWKNENVFYKKQSFTKNRTGLYLATEWKTTRSHTTYYEKHGVLAILEKARHRDLNNDTAFTHTALDVFENNFGNKVLSSICKRTRRYNKVSTWKHQ
jgi:hypothetical protein